MLFTFYTRINGKLTTNLTYSKHIFSSHRNEDTEKLIIGVINHFHFISLLLVFRCLLPTKFPWRPSRPAFPRARPSSLPSQGATSPPSSTPTRHSVLLLHVVKIRRTVTCGGSSSVVLASVKAPTLAVFQISLVFLTSPLVISFVMSSLHLVHFLPRFENFFFSL